MEKIIETKTCTHCWVSFPITDKDIEFYDKVSPIFGGVKYTIPTPTLCPDCRNQRRLSFRNERNLYRRKCEATGKSIISIYSPDKPYKVYEQSEWWSDKWDALEYGKNFDFSRGFFEQFEELWLHIPKLQILVSLCENSDYTNGSAYNKNCYLIFASDHNEECYYSDNIYRCNNVFDSSDLNDCNICYECIGSTKCNNCYYLFDCHDCNDMMFCFDCKNCNNCFLSSNLRNKKFYFKNKEYSEEEYLKKIEKYKSKSNAQIFEELIQIKNNSIHLSFHGIGNENCLWDYISNCKNSRDIYSANNLEDCKHIINGNWAKDCQDWYVVVDNSSLVYEGVSIVLLNKWAFNFWCWNWSSDIYYSDHCQTSHNLFGCIWLSNKSYCIFNKQYTREEYEALVPKIIEHMKSTWEWGEFFPSSISPFGYNETVASEYYPLGRDVAVQRLYKWSDYENPRPDVSKIIPASKLPDDITKIPDDILNWAIECEVTGKPFRIIKQELEFYRKHNLPIPRRHPDQRHLDRMALRNPRKLFERKCDKCGMEIQTTYSPERPEIVYCENCYNKEIL